MSVRETSVNLFIVEVLCASLPQCCGVDNLKWAIIRAALQPPSVCTQTPPPYSPIPTRSPAVETVMQIKAQQAAAQQAEAKGGRA
jgi:hypothetical protein